jgi:hypothetical protein
MTDYGLADILERVDGNLTALVSSEPDAMASHLSYEERELVEPLARCGFY